MLAADKTMDVTWMCGDHLQGEITIGSILSTKDHTLSIYGSTELWVMRLSVFLRAM